MYKLLALDIDFTLLRDDLTISKRNLDAIEAARAMGVTVTIVTGRGYPGTKIVCDKIGLDVLPVVTFGGAQVVFHPSGEILFKEVMPLNLVRECINFARDIGEHIQCYDDENYYISEENKYSDIYFKRIGYKGTVSDLNNIQIENCYKCLIVTDPEKCADIVQKAKKHFGDRVSVTASSDSFIEMYKPNVDKSTALRWMADKMGISREEIIAIGDNAIDVPMIKFAGLGVAVANATESAKDVADYIAPSNNDDGVAHVIEKFILGGKNG